MNQFYAVRWFDSSYYTSINHIDYVRVLMQRNRPVFYNYLVYELVETEATFGELTRRLPLNQQLQHVAVWKLHSIEKQVLRYHMDRLRDHITHP